jgi:hypothetical protein
VEDANGDRFSGSRAPWFRLVGDAFARNAARREFFGRPRITKPDGPSRRLPPSSSVIQERAGSALWVPGTGTDGQAREVHLYHVVDNAWAMAEFGAQCVLWQTAGWRLDSR